MDHGPLLYGKPQFENPHFVAGSTPALQHLVCAQPGAGATLANCTKRPLDVEAIGVGPATGE